MRIELYRQICMNFNKEPNEDLFLLWKEELEDYDTYYIEIAIKNIIKKDKYFPTLNRIIEELKNLPVIEIPTSEKIKRFKKVIPNWLHKNITSEPIEEDIEFNKFIEDFRNGKL